MDFKRQDGALKPPYQCDGSWAVSREIATLDCVQQPAQQVGGLLALPAVHVMTVTVG